MLIAPKVWLFGGEKPSISKEYGEIYDAATNLSYNNIDPSFFARRHKLRALVAWAQAVQALPGFEHHLDTLHRKCADPGGDIEEWSDAIVFFRAASVEARKAAEAVA
jgi:hypothetical protein